MKIYQFLRGGAVCAAALLTASFAVLNSYAEEESEEEQEVPVYTSGDYTYSILKNEDDENERAACLESYTGSEAELTVPSELDGLSVVRLGERAFVQADYLKKITLPKTVTELGDYSFAESLNIEEYIVEEGNPVLSAEDGVLYSNDGKVLQRYPLGSNPVDVTVPEGVLAIGNVAFAESPTLKTVTLPESLTYIGVSAFSGCNEMTEITIPDAVTEIDAFAFNSCTNLKTVKLPAELLSIGAASFSMTAIENITLPDKLMAIGQQAFISTPMKEITIPGSVSEMNYASVGWEMTPSGMAAKKDFIIYGYANSTAEEYASDEELENSFQFSELSMPASESSDDAESSAAEEESAASEESAADTETIGEEKDTVHPGKVIGISACGAAILGIIAAAAFSGKKKSNKEKKDDA